MGEGLHLQQRNEEISDLCRVLQKIRSSVWLRLPDASGSGISRVIARSESTEPTKSGGHHAGNSKICGCAPHWYSRRERRRKQYPCRREDAEQHRTDLL